jgi:pyruvate dehydrogenase phosphatase
VLIASFATVISLSVLSSRKSLLDTISAEAKEDTPDEQQIIRDTYALHMNDLRAKQLRGKLYTAAGGAVRFHGVQHASNSPCEDEIAHDKAESVGPEKWAYWAIFDGHAGGATSKLLRDSLITEVAKNLVMRSSDESINDNIKHTFRRIDDIIIRRGLDTVRLGPDIKSNKDILAQAYAGSCALLAMLDLSSSTLRVAVTGDSRAVLGRYFAPKASYVAVPMSIDQNGNNPVEKERIDGDHPGEDKVINPKSGRVLGMAISRAFGDSRWKWSEGDSLLAHKTLGGPKMRGLGPPGSVATPPYLTAEPEIEETVVTMGPKEPNADFLIMASDGFWDHVSNDDAVTCVVEWVHHQAYNTKFKQKPPPGISDAHDRRLWSAFGGSSPIEWPLKKGAWGDWHVDPDDFVYEEHNAATHLVQNAFGGKRRGLFCGAMAEKHPMSRWARDDISVYVIFFGKVGGKTIIDEPDLMIV